MQRTLLNQIARFDHLLQIVRDIRPQVITAQRQFADGQLIAADAVKDQALHVVDVLDVLAVQLELEHVEELAVQPLNQLYGIIIGGGRCHFKFSLWHID